MNLRQLVTDQEIKDNNGEFFIPTTGIIYVDVHCNVNIRQLLKSDSSIIKTLPENNHSMLIDWCNNNLQWKFFTHDLTNFFKDFKKTNFIYFENELDAVLFKLTFS